MSFPLARLQADVSRRINAQGSYFQDDFLAAVADVVDDIIIESIIEATAFDPDAPHTEIDVPAKYYSVVREGVIYRMMLNKRYNTAGEPVNASRYFILLNRLKAQAMLDEDVPVGMDFEP